VLNKLKNFLKSCVNLNETNGICVEVCFVFDILLRHAAATVWKIKREIPKYFQM
jgi:hypothetical protein